METMEKLTYITETKAVNVYFANLSFDIEDACGIKRIINGASGRFLSGELSAIMGPSGAGKTSLLNILTGYQRTGVQGVIEQQCPSFMKNVTTQHKNKSCYILQDDTLPAFLTVQESMEMCCKLKMDNLTEKSMSFLIDDILDNLGLVKCRNTRCQNLSGGQRKRVSIALELVDNPPIMFLDEPTTGLDSSSAAQCIKMLKNLARGGRTIICTIHQPTASLYELFDHVYIVAGGRCVYQGASTNTVEYLSSCGLQCPQYHNPADYLLEVVSGEYGDYVGTLANAANDDKWRGPSPAFKIHRRIDLEQDSGVTGKPRQVCEIPSEWTKFCILLMKNARYINRDHSVMHLKMFLNILVGIGIGITYQNHGKAADKVIGNIGFLLASLVYLSFTAIMPAVLKFPSELQMLKKEVFNHWYDLKTYFTAFLVYEIPFQIIFSLTYHIPSYYISDQPNEFLRFAKVLLIDCLTSLSSSGLGLLLGSSFNPINGTFIGSIILAMMICLGGFLILYTHMTGYGYFFTYFSFISYASEGVIQSLYGYDRAPLHCPESEDYCQYISPTLFLKDVGMDKQNYWIDVSYILVTFVAYSIVTLLVLKKRIGAT